LLTKHASSHTPDLGGELHARRALATRAGLHTRTLSTHTRSPPSSAGLDFHPASPLRVSSTSCIELFCTSVRIASRNTLDA
jgi:hypothetical protein